MSRPQSPLLTWALRALAVLGLTAFVLYYAVDLGRDPGFGSPKFALWAWITSLGWLVVVQGMVGVTIVFGDDYYRPRPFEEAGRLYRALGVPLFAWLMVNGPLYNRLARRLKPAHRVVGGRRDLDRWEATTRSKEASHLVHALVMLPCIAATVLLGWPEAAGLLLLLTVLFDLYPVMLQRYNRERLFRLRARALRSAGSAAGA